MNSESFLPNDRLTPEARRAYASGMSGPGLPEGEGAPQPTAEQAHYSQMLQVLTRIETGIKELTQEVGEGNVNMGIVAEVLARQQRVEGEEAQQINLTQRLEELQNSISRGGTEEKVRVESNFVLNLGRKWKKDIEGNSRLKEMFEKKKVSDLMDAIEVAQGAGKMDDAAMAKAVELAKILREFSFQPELKEFGYFDQPKNFEDLMELLAASENPEFQPGGEFAIFKRVPLLDDNGKPIYKFQRENRPPEMIYNIEVNHHNFLRWLMDREMYFIGQNPFSEIHLFQDISVPSLNPIPMSYITNNPKFWISEQWIPYEKLTELNDQEYADYEERKSKGEDKRKVIESEDGKHILVEKDYRLERTAPPELRNLQDEVILSLYLTETEHNMDVAYFTEGMKSEEPLKEVMGKICNSNFLTRFFSMMMNAPSTNQQYNDDPNDERRSEVMAWLKGGLEMNHQGRLGKAQQRALGMFYHLAQANAIANGQTFEDGISPFVELLQAEDGTDRSVIFYKSLARQTIEDHFKEEVAGVKDLVDALNKRKTAMHPTGKRYDWEKVDLLDLLFLDRDELGRELDKIGLSLDDLDEEKRELERVYGSGEEQKQKKGQLNNVATTRVNSKQEFLASFAKAKDKHGQAKLKLSLEDLGVGEFSDFYNSKGYNGISYFGVKFFTRAFDKSSTPDANIYSHIKYSDVARKKVFQAIADTVSHTDHVDVFEAKYATERSFRKTYFMGISAENDTMAIGHDRLAQVIKQKANRIRQMDRAANYYGFEETLGGFEQIGLNMFQAINGRVGSEHGFERPLYEIVMGFDETKKKYDMNKDIGYFELPGNSMRQYFSDHLINAIDIHLMLRKAIDMDIVGKFSSTDSLGRTVFDHEAFKKFIDGIRKQLHYCFDNQGIQYNKQVGGWTVETYLERDEKTGELVPKFRVIFGIKKIKDMMFSEKLRNMGMYERPDLGGAGGQARGTEKQQMARNVLAYLIAMQMKAHRREGKSYWNAQFIEQAAEALRKYGVGVLEMADDEAIFLRGFFTAAELRVILGAAGIFLWTIYAKEYGEDAMGGLLAGIFESFSMIMGDMGAAIKL